jgi:N-acetylneuraminate synthase
VIKLQTYTAATITLDVDRPEFRISSGHDLWGGRRLWDLYEQASTPWEWHRDLFELADGLGVPAFSSPFDETAVEFLESLGCPAYKIASLEIVDTPLIRLAASTGKPLVISTGGASLREIEEAVDAARDAGCTDLVLLKCTTAYPAPATEANLRAMVTLADEFDCLVGLSDHTKGSAVAIAAVALGAVAIEKHVTVSRDDGGVDSAFSLESDELRHLVNETRSAWQALGAASPGPTDSERESLRFRPSLWVVRDVEPGERVTPDTVRSLRPAGGLAPSAWTTIEGRVFRTAVAAGTAMSTDLLERGTVATEGGLP